MFSLKGERGRVIKRKRGSLSSPRVTKLHLSLPNQVLLLDKKTFDFIKGLNCQHSGNANMFHWKIISKYS